MMAEAGRVLIIPFLAVFLLVSCGVGYERKLESTVEGQLEAVREVIAVGPFRPTWESLKEFQVPDWYQDAKFGLFIHWGIYSVPAFGNEWYPRNMYKQGSREFEYHVKTFGPQLNFGYKDFIPNFKAERFDPDEWARLFRESGAKYIVPVAEHHDGFPMYDCGLTDWSAAKMGPHRDVIGELAATMRREGLHFGVSSHRAENWWFYDQGRTFNSDVGDPANAGLYGAAQPREKAEDQSLPPSREHLDDWLARTSELIDKYHPELIWFDWWIAQPFFHDHLRRLAAFYYNRGVEWDIGVAINYKKHGGSSFPDEAAVLDIERGQLSGIRQLFWQTDTSVSKNSWGYISDHDYKTVDSIVDDLIDIVSKNGCLLLNIGPRPDGTIPEPEVEMLKSIGGWLKVNGEAVYGTRPWKVFGEGPTNVVEGTFNDTKRGSFTAKDIRFTTKGGVVYATFLDWPKSRSLVIRSMVKDSEKAPVSITLLGYEGSIDWRQTVEGLIVNLPERKPGEYAFVLKIE